MISSATGRIAVAVVCVLALALALGFLLPGHASSNAPTPRSAPVANIQSPQLQSPVTPKAPVLPPATVPPAAAPASVATAPPWPHAKSSASPPTGAWARARGSTWPG